MSDAIKHITDDIFFSKTAHWCTCIVHATQFNCCGALDFLSPEPCPQQPLADKIQGVIQQREYESWVRKTEEVKEWLVEFWRSTYTAFQWKMRFSCFLVLPGSVEAIWGGIAKCLLIAYFIGNISAKKISKCIHVCQSYSKPKVGRFETL